jgi:hypothetical protein
MGLIMGDTGDMSDLWDDADIEDDDIFIRFAR